jgi:8-hydroxy-5-deazaflavin:NADPH oxidoreductase
MEMKIGIIGGGGVAQAIGGKLKANGHDVVIGIRNPSDAELAKERQMAKPLKDWIKETGAKVASFADAAKHGDILVNATNGGASIEALTQAGAANIGNKILIDIANPLDFSKGMPPSLLPAYAYGTSLGEEIQKAFPDAKVVKTLNTISNTIMINPGAIAKDHDLLMAGNDTEAKAKVTALVKKEFGWTSVVDLGDIAGARGTEHILPLWVRLWGVLGTPTFNIKIVKG